ncbi:MAG: ABC transporter ATP-binding protein, partial [Eggerthellaceae bacterium]|nr:ABC transporter ATP-binding protein [Eggerthellaceae bacterium]
ALYRAAEDAHVVDACCAGGGAGDGANLAALADVHVFKHQVLYRIDVTEGAIRMNGHDVRNLSQEALRRTLAFVPQQTYLFDGTIESNVSFGCEEDDGERVKWALDVAQATDFVAEKEGGVEAEVAQGGSNFSGGQRQRLAIARALATGAKAFLFDDSFSALDYRTDSALRQRLAQDLAGRTVIIVAQRIATVMNADRIIVLDEGRMAGMGTHAQLMETCGAYREIALSQLSEEELAKGVR